MLSSWKQSKKDQIKKLKTIYKKQSIVKFWENCFDAIVNKKVDSWAFQWAYNCIFQNGFSVVPMNNLVSNIGRVGAHTKSPGPFFKMPVKEFLACNVRFPDAVTQNWYLDKIVYKKHGIIKPFSFKKVVKNMIKPIYHFLRS
jgi:hypothetical protein